MLEYNICYSSDSNYAEQLAVSMASVLSNAKKQENINFYVLDGGLSTQDKQNIELLKNIKDFSINYVEINEDDFKSCPILKDKDEKYSSYHVTLPTYFRFKLASLLPNVGKILYLDCDVIVRNSLEEFYTMPVKDSAALMILDAESKQESKRIEYKNYFNAGVMLINLDYWRKNNVEKRLFDYAKENADTILWQDQDVINIVLQNEIKKVSEKWNFQYFLYEKIDVKKLSEIKVFHLAGRFKPWLIPFEHPVYDYYYYYLFMTPWKNKAIQYKEMAMGKTLKDNIGGRNTNILVNATDADIQKVYAEFANVYKSFENIKTGIIDEANSQITKVYEEIGKNYEFTRNIVVENHEKSNILTDEKIGKVYEEIAKNYDYTDEKLEFSKNEVKEFVDVSVKKISDFCETKSQELLSTIEENTNQRESFEQKIEETLTGISSDLELNKQNIVSQLDEKITKVYDEISNNYEFTKDIVSKLQEQSNTQLNEQVANIYGEITKNYEYTDEIRDGFISDISDLKSDISSSQQEITNFVENSVRESVELIENKTEQINKNLQEKYDEFDSKTEQNAKLISNVSTDIQNLYEKFVLENANINLNQKRIEEQLSEEIKNNQSAISQINDELQKNNDYVEALVEETQLKLNDKIQKIDVETQQISVDLNLAKENINIIKDDLNIVKDNLNIQKDEILSTKEDVLNLNAGIENLNKSVENLNNNIQNTQKTFENEITNVITNTNEQMNKAFTEINENYRLVDAKIDKRSYENYMNVQNAFQQIDGLRFVVDKKVEKQELTKSIDGANEKIQMLEVEYQNKLSEMKTMFEDELNKQRIKYERKLIEMENIIASMDDKYQPKKKSIFSKIKERLNK